MRKLYMERRRAAPSIPVGSAGAIRANGGDGGDNGGEHAAAILFEELRDVMAQLGVQNIAGLSEVSVTRDNH